MSRPAILFMVVIALTATQGCSSNPVAEGDEAFEAGDFGKALSVYESALSRGDVTRGDVGARLDECRSKLAAAARDEAAALAAEADFDAAFEKLEKAGELAPGDAANSAGIARIRTDARAALEAKAAGVLAAGDAEAAVELLERSAKWADDPGPAAAKAVQILCDAAEKALSEGKFQLASDFASKAEKREKGQPRAAAVFKALAENKALVDGLMAEAQALRQDGKYEEACAALDKALAAWPGYPAAEAMAAATAKERDFWTFFRAGDNYLARKEWDKAVAAFEKAQEVDALPTVAAKIREAKFSKFIDEAGRLEGQKKVEEAIAALEKALEFAPDQGQVEAKIRSMKYSMLLDKGMSHEVKGEWLKALDAYKKASDFAEDKAEINRRIVSAKDHIVTVKCDKCDGSGQVDDYRIQEKDGKRDMVKVGTKPCPQCEGKGFMEMEKK